MNKPVSAAYVLTLDFSTIPAFVSPVLASNAQGTTDVKAYLDGVEDTSLIVSGSVAYSGSQVQALISGGEDGKNYTLVFTAADSNGQVYPSTIQIAVCRGY